jgi:hypothetical protein
VSVTDDHAWPGPWGEYSVALRLGDKSSAEAAKSLNVVEQSFVRDFIPINVMSGLDKCLQHMVWSWIWCWIAITVIAFR